MGCIVRENTRRPPGTRVGGGQGHGLFQGIPRQPGHPWQVPSPAGARRRAFAFCSHPLAPAELITILQNSRGSLGQGWQNRADHPSPGAQGYSAAGPTETVRGLTPAPRLLWGASCSPELGRWVPRTESPLPRQLCLLCLAGLPAFFPLQPPRFSDARPSQLSAAPLPAGPVIASGCRTCHPATRQPAIPRSAPTGPSPRAKAPFSHEPCPLIPVE